jgi:hypothetical protein
MIYKDLEKKLYYYFLCHKGGYGSKKIINILELITLLRSGIRSGMGRMEFSREFVEKLSEIFFEDEINEEIEDPSRFEGEIR